MVMATLTGCAAAPGAPPAGGQFDGVYVGESTLVRGFGFVCGLPSYPLSIPVKDGQFDYTIQVPPYGNPPIVVHLQADGSLAGAVLYTAENYTLRGPDYRYAWINIAGHVTGPALDATVTDLRCTRQLSLQRR